MKRDQQTEDIIFMVRAVMLMKAIISHGFLYEKRGGWFACYFCDELEDADHNENCLFVRVEKFIREFDES